MDITLTLVPYSTKITLKRSVLTVWRKCLFAQALEEDTTASELTLERPEVTPSVIEFLNKIAEENPINQQDIRQWLLTETEMKAKVGPYLNIPFLTMLGHPDFISFLERVRPEFEMDYYIFRDTMRTYHLAEAIYAQLHVVVDWLLDHNGIIRRPMAEQQTAYILAIARNNHRFVKLYLEAKLNPQISLDPRRWDVIKANFYREEDTDLVRQLDAICKFDLTHKAVKGYGPLFLAVARGNTQIVGQLLPHFDCRAPIGGLLVNEAISGHNLEMSTFFLEFKGLGLGVHATGCLQSAVKTHDRQYVRLVLQHPDITAEVLGKHISLLCHENRFTVEISTLYISHPAVTPELKTKIEFIQACNSGQTDKVYHIEFDDFPFEVLRDALMTTIPYGHTNIAGMLVMHCMYHAYPLGYMPFMRALQFDKVNITKIFFEYDYARTHYVPSYATALGLMCKFTLSGRMEAYLREAYAQ